MPRAVIFHLTVSGITASNKVYDGNTTATLNTASATLVGVVGSDSITLNTTGASGTFANKNVGTSKTVTVSGLTLGGADAGNYSLTQPTTTANITAKELTVSGIIASNKVYDGNTMATLNTTSATLVGVVGSESVALNTAGASGTFGNKNVGTGKTVTVSGLTISGTDAGNYTLTQPTTTANITPKELTVTGITANNKVYDGTATATLNTASATLIGVVGSDSVALNTAGAVGTFADTNVGTGKTVTVSGLTISGTDASNYSLTQPTTTANITQASTATTLSVSSQQSTVGQSVTFTATVSRPPSATSQTSRQPREIAPTGTVTFTEGITVLGARPLDKGVAIFVTSLSVGSHNITAIYGGDQNHAGSSSNPVSHQVNAAKLFLPAILNPLMPLAGYWEAPRDRFTVRSDRVSVINFASSFDVPSCNIYDYWITYSGPVTIANNRFSFGGTFYADITFNSQTSAQGTVGINNYLFPNCGYRTGGPNPTTINWKSSSTVPLSAPASGAGYLPRVVGK